MSGYVEVSSVFPKIILRRKMTVSFGKVCQKVIKCHKLQKLS